MFFSLVFCVQYPLHTNTLYDMVLRTINFLIFSLYSTLLLCLAQFIDVMQKMCSFLFVSPYQTYIHIIKIYIYISTRHNINRSSVSLCCVIFFLVLMLPLCVGYDFISKQKCFFLVFLLLLIWSLSLVYSINVLFWSSCHFESAQHLWIW